MLKKSQSRKRLVALTLILLMSTSVAPTAYAEDGNKGPGDSKNAKLKSKIISYVFLNDKNKEINGTELWNQSTNIQHTFFLIPIIAGVAAAVAKAAVAASAAVVAGVKIAMSAAATVAVAAKGAIVSAAAAAKGIIAAKVTAAGVIKTVVSNVAVTAVTEGAQAIAKKVSEDNAAKAAADAATAGTPPAEAATAGTPAAGAPAAGAPAAGAPADAPAAPKDNLDTAPDILGSNDLNAIYFGKYSDQQIMAFAEAKSASPEQAKKLLELNGQAKEKSKEEAKAAEEYLLKSEQEDLLLKKIWEGTEQVGNGAGENIKWENLGDGLETEAAQMVQAKKAELKQKATSPQKAEPKLIKETVAKQESASQELDGTITANKEVQNALDALEAKKKANQPFEAETQALTQAVEKLAREEEQDEQKQKALEEDGEFADLFVYDGEIKDTGFDIPTDELDAMLEGDEGGSAGSSGSSED